MRRSRSLVLLFILYVVQACGSEPTASEALAGTFVARKGVAGTLTLTDVSTGATTDMLARGATIDLTLAEGGATSGRLYVPDGEEDGGTFEADLAGSWALQGGVVRLSHTADTFLRDMPLQPGNGRLTAEKTFGDVRVSLVLERQGR